MSAHMKNFDVLLEVANTLLGPEGCPWDREQTFQSLRPYLLEETHEVLEAVDEGDINCMVEELGDLLFVIIFYATLGRIKNLFSIEEVVDGVREKIVRRHPHIFGKEKADSAQEVLVHWERMKGSEKKKNSTIPKLDFVHLWRLSSISYCSSEAYDLRGRLE
jgi:tetrapyrrole methylase family protein/MazG family protein